MIAPLLKALLVHGANWPDAYERFAAVLRTPANAAKFREFASRFFGFGLIDRERIRSSTEQRATLIGCGYLENEKAHLYSLPLPPGLSGQREWKRLTVTLSWLTSINAEQQRYRKAALWYEFDPGILRVKRQEADARTVQHEVFEGEDALAYVDGDTLDIKVNCREDASKLREQIPYALAVSIEVAAGVPISIYDEIRARVLQPVPIRAPRA